MKQSLREKRLLVDKAAETVFSVLPPSGYLRMRWWYHHLSRSQKEREKVIRQRAVTRRYEICFKPFDDHKAIFVHVPKCAGNSVLVALFGNIAGGHSTLTDYLGVFEPDCIASYFKFTIVRNPWDRLVSGYHYLKAGGNRQNDEDRAWFNSALGHYKDFDDFVKGWVNKRNIWKTHYFRPQYHFILEGRGKVGMDFVGFLENLDEDFVYIANRVGVDCHLDHRNKSEHTGYADFYTNETRQIVADVYDTDIALLGYNFDNSSLPEQLAQRSANITWNRTPPPLPKGVRRYL